MTQLLRYYARLSMRLVLPVLIMLLSVYTYLMFPYGKTLGHLDEITRNYVRKDVAEFLISTYLLWISTSIYLSIILYRKVNKITLVTFDTIWISFTCISLLGILYVYPFDIFVGAQLDKVEQSIVDEVNSFFPELVDGDCEYHVALCSCRSEIDLALSQRKYTKPGFIRRLSCITWRTNKHNEIIEIVANVRQYNAIMQARSFAELQKKPSLIFIILFLFASGLRVSKSICELMKEIYK